MVMIVTEYEILQESTYFTKYWENEAINIIR